MRSETLSAYLSEVCNTMDADEGRQGESDRKVEWVGRKRPGSMEGDLKRKNDASGAGIWTC